MPRDTARDEPGFGESKLALGVIKKIPSYSARSYTEVLPAGCWDDASRPARPSIHRLRPPPNYSLVEFPAPTKL